MSRSHQAPRRAAATLVTSALAAVLALGLAGCGSSGTEHTVTIDGLKWTPAEIEIEVGDTVVWDMESNGMPHDVVSDDELFASELMTEGEFRYTFTEAGEYGYHCTPHPPMIGTITVVEP
ncbi:MULTISPECIES: plastocyanin/azurin family copper-binding protein [Micrococcales]|uniref:Copper binding protein, plastocyanin/azurin family n=1 Tax=Agrococcus casei LMG 22410 TaxID=1255656 RepID=A0A1R4EPH6_9MICO|nr:MULTISPECIES: plastocyanin/azurin family copper-binding protein [Micrococcales]SJM45607.1 Copper binding protein, plastocyanin/azurin family [Agrococcus casei LMG 22410]